MRPKAEERAEAPGILEIAAAPGRLGHISRQRLLHLLLLFPASLAALLLRDRVRLTSQLPT